MMCVSSPEKPIDTERKQDLFLTEKVTDLDTLVGFGDSSVDGEMSVDKTHLIAVPLGDAGDEILDVAEGGADGGGGLAGAEPGVDLKLALAGLVLDELEIKVEMLEVAAELSSWALHLDDLRLHFDGHTFWYVHRLRGQYGLHLSPLSATTMAAQARRLMGEETKLNPTFQKKPNCSYSLKKTPSCPFFSTLVASPKTQKKKT